MLALVNTVNTVGVIREVIALAFKQRFPPNFQAYAASCQRGDLQTERIEVVLGKLAVQVHEPL
ncbi:MAG: macro domain-containing protein [Burkholderiaceae bacterium]|nr:macro domain-containing protein [Burkholderiaceae bacterium]